MSEAIARKLHDLYEALAPSYGYETRKDTRDFDPRSPNGQLMIEVCSEVFGELTAEVERLREALKCCEGIAFDFSEDEIKSEATSVRFAWKLGNESLRNQGPAEGGADDE